MARPWLLLVLLTSPVACGGPAEPTSTAISDFSVGIVPLNGFGYRATFARGGSATDIRSGDLAPDVECTGVVSEADYENVADLIAARGFFALDGQYGFHVDYPPIVFTSATREGEHKTVKNYPGAGPSSLIQVQRAVRALREKVAWSAKSGQATDQRLCSSTFFFGEP